MTPLGLRRRQDAPGDQSRHRRGAGRAAGRYGTLADLFTSLQEAQAAGVWIEDWKGSTNAALQMRWDQNPRRINGLENQGS
jgi:hypothetical protein